MKHGTKIFILLFSILVMSALLIPASAEYTGPNSSARRYTYTVESTCSEPYSCCTAWSSESCGTHEWDIGCCLSYGTCYKDVDCEETVTANHPDATISMKSVCSTGFGENSWCAGDITVNLTGKDEWKGIKGFESSDGKSASAGGKHTETASFTYTGEQNESVDYWALSTLGDNHRKEKQTWKVLSIKKTTHPLQD